jgi:UDP-N-acetylglucosamine--N-acetylmuramyl-(pentapeptide) pyrophosphoryl-undecaprenol N-acetylglucosamine transferase
VKVIISGGGTGGHIFPAIAVAQELRGRADVTDILFVGARGRMEMDRVPKAGFEIIGLPVSGFQRRLSYRNLLFPFRLLSSLWKAHRIVRRFRPDVVVGFGGYASGPVSKAAEWNRVPVVLQEQNSYAGVTNRLLARKAEKICVAYPGMERFFDERKIEFTGNPVRKDILSLNDIKEESHEYFGLVQNKKTILIFGGSLGAGSLNEAVRHNLKLLSDRFDLQFIWQAGQYYYDSYREMEEAKRQNVVLLPFIERMDLAYAAADLVVCRAGALTISELSLAAKPAVLVPSPNVAEDHQTQNARSLSDIGAAWLLRDAEVVEKLGELITEILDDPGQLAAVAEKIKPLGKPNAAEEIAAVIRSVAGSDRKEQLKL